MFHDFIVEKYRYIGFCDFRMSGVLTSDQRWRSCCILSDGKYNNNNNNTSNKKARSKNQPNTMCDYTPGHEMSGRPRYDEVTSYTVDAESLGYMVFYCSNF